MCLVYMWVWYTVMLPFGLQHWKGLVHAGVSLSWKVIAILSDHEMDHTFHFLACSCCSLTNLVVLVAYIKWVNTKRNHLHNKHQTIFWWMPFLFIPWWNARSVFWDYISILVCKLNSRRGETKVEFSHAKECINHVFIWPLFSHACINKVLRIANLGWTIAI